MHYTGMAAVELPAEAIWDLRYVLASVLIGISVGLGMHFAVRRKSRADYVLERRSLHRSPSGHAFHRHGGGALLSPNGHASPLAMAPFAWRSWWRPRRCSSSARAWSWPWWIVIWPRAQGEAQRLRDHIAELEAHPAGAGEDIDRPDRRAGRRHRASKSKSAFLASMSHELRTPLECHDRLFRHHADGKSSGRWASATRICLGHPRQRRASAVADQRHPRSSRLDAGHGELREEVFDPRGTGHRCLRMVASQARKATVTLITDWRRMVSRI